MKIKDTQKIGRLNFSAIVFALALTLSGFGHNALASGPGNDNFANAEVLSGIQVHITRSNTQATKEAGEPNHAGNIGGKSVWFKWTAPMTREMTFSTNRTTTGLDTLLHIYTGAALNALSTEIFNDNIYSPGNLKSSLRVMVHQGTTYYIAVDGANQGQGAAEGIFQLDIQPNFTVQGADYDNDGQTDLSFFRPSTGTWQILYSSVGQTRTIAWGTNGDIPLVSEQGTENDHSVFRPSTGVWYDQTCCQTTFTNWGASGDIPVPANFGGGPNTSLAVFRPATGAWYIRFAENNYAYYQFGLQGDIPVPGHYSADQFADIAVFRPSTGVWYFLKRQGGDPATDQFGAVQFGQLGDKPVPADYDGDGILDAAVYRPSTGVWYVLRSSDSQTQAFQWGISEDIPTTGDFDGDGKFDYAVFRPSTGTWYVYRSGDASFQVKQFGQLGDIPVTANRTF